MMTNLLNGAHVANKLFSTIARLRLLLVMFVALTVSAEVWGAEETATNTCNSAVPGNATDLESGKLIQWKVSSTNTYNTPIRVYANTTITISAKTGVKRISKVEITASSTGNYVTYTKDATWTASGIGTCSVGTKTTSGTLITVPMNGDVTTVTIKPSSQTRWSKVVVTYETAASYTVTYNANGGSGTMSNSTGSSIEIKECTFTAPECKQFTSWNTAANGSGTSYAPNATVTTNLTLYAQWGDLPSYTVKLMDNNEVLTSSCNTPITLPSRDGCDGYEFVGWTKSWFVAQTTWTTTVPTIIPTGSYTPTANESLYPVYTKTEGGGSEPIAYSAGDEGDFVIASYNTSNSKWYAIPENPTLSSSKITGVEITVSQTAGGVNYVSTANAEGYTWTIADATNGQTISDGSKYIYHSNGGSSGTNLAYGTSTSYTWKIEKENNGLTFKGMSGSTTNSRGLLFNGSVFGGYALSNEDQSGYYRIQVLPIGGGSTTSYISVPECSTQTSRCVTPKMRG